MCPQVDAWKAPDDARVAANSAAFRPRTQHQRQHLRHPSLCRALRALLCTAALHVLPRQLPQHILLHLLMHALHQLALCAHQGTLLSEGRRPRRQRWRWGGTVCHLGREGGGWASGVVSKPAQSCWERRLFPLCRKTSVLHSARVVRRHRRAVHRGKCRCESVGGRRKVCEGAISATMAATRIGRQVQQMCVSRRDASHVTYTLPWLRSMVEEGAKGAIVVDRSGLAVAGAWRAPARATTPLRTHARARGHAVAGCFSASDAGYVRSLLPKSLANFSEPVAVSGVEHQVVVSPLPGALQLALAVAMPHPTEG